MENFIIGMVLGYFLYPVAGVVGKIFSNAWDASNGCAGNCNQGRSPCDCRGKQNGIS